MVTKRVSGAAMITAMMIIPTTVAEAQRVDRDAPARRAAPARAEEPLWRENAHGSPGAPGGKQRSSLAVGQSKAFELNEELLTELLARAPMEFTQAARGTGNEITLPTPEGVLARFRFVESPIMEPELAARFPEIKTYRGWGIDDPTATTRFLKTGRGFHALVHSPKDTFSIDPGSGDPSSGNDTLTYTSSPRVDVAGSGLACSIGRRKGAMAGHDPVSALASARGDDPLALPSATASGTVLRSLRLAAAATGEYTMAFVDPPGALAEINTVVNDVNVVYESELAVRFVLVGNNLSILFPERYLDPYESGDPDEVLGENQDVLDSIIGASNYDIGHVFDTRFEQGGAHLGSACIDGDKGRGLSSSPSGAGLFGMVVHELGHQLGANHTFNGDCGDGNDRNDLTAYEPGCGKTFMSYGADKILRFHGTSLRAIAHHLDGVGSCGTTNNNNRPPQVSVSLPAPSNPLGFHVIPVQTPFTLTASGSDADQDPVTYGWEDIDSGSPGPWDADRGNNPLFASQEPTADPSASFPPLRLLGMTPAPLMATTARWLGFLVTARDNRGGFAQDSVLLTVDDQTGPFVVTAPSAGTEVIGGQPMTVTWDVAGTDGGYVNAPFVRILYSTDGGNTFPTTLASSTPNDGSFMFTPPCVSTISARVKVEAIDNIFFAASPEFKIVGPTIRNSSPRPPILRLSQGGPAATIRLATVSDVQELPGSLSVRPVSVPNGLSLVIHNNAGVISATASAECSLPAGLLNDLQWEVENSAGCKATSILDVSVSLNAPPTLGTYGNVSVPGGQSTTVSPSAPPADPNGNLSEVAVWTTTTPLLATLSSDTTTGAITIGTNGSTRPGTYDMRAWAADGCGRVSATRGFFLTVENTPPIVLSLSNPARTAAGGPPGAPAAVAVVSDAQDAPGALTVSASAPAGLTIAVTNSNGIVSASATATCTVAPGTYNASLTVTDSALANVSTTFPVIVDPNLPPTLGAYFDSGVTVGGSVRNVPNAPPSDPGNPAVPVSVSVNPPILPGGGQVIPFADGHVEINTVFSTTPGTYQISVTGRDACGATTTRSFRVTVRSAACVIEQGVVFAADTGNHRIQRLSGSNWSVIGLGTQGTGLGQFASPEAVVASANGQRIYVADTGNSRIQWSQNGGGAWAVFASGLIPQGLVLDRDGNLYVADARDSLVLRYRSGVPGSPTVLASSGSGTGQVRNPNGLAIDCRMNLYVADTGNNRILTIVTADSTMIPNTGTILAGSAAGLNPAQVTAPQGVAVDNNGRLYVADTGSDRVLTIASAPVPGAATALCTVGGALGQVRKPEGVTIAAFTSGQFAGVSSIGVSDSSNDRIQARALPAGAWMLLGGNGQFKRPSKVR